MLLEVDTDIPGLTAVLAVMAWLNAYDVRRDPRLLEELRRRVEAPPGVGFQYHRDPAFLGLCPAPDRWSTFSVLAGRTPKDQPIKADCEDLSAIYAAAALMLTGSRAEVCIAQPREGAMAHAFCRIDGRVFDPSVLHGMPSPPPNFYTTGSVSCVDMERFSQ